jgi:SAM-dependent methyltransferase
MDPHLGELFDEYAGDYDATIQQALGASGESVAFFAGLRADFVAQLIGPIVSTFSVLDFGCGVGNMTREVARRLPTASVVGTDLSERSVATARSRSSEGSNVRYDVTPSDRLPFPDASFDFAFASGVFHHIVPRDRAHWAKELRRILVPGGRFCLFEHNPANPFTTRVVRRIPFDRDAQLIKPRDGASLLEQTGFSVSPVHYYFYFPRFLRALRRFEPLLRRIPIGAQYFVVGRAS